ncbi:MAG: hypothetical protein V2I65_18775 [Paracoccaceae bacterium]|nr:hypothetical protein [Paracoccaceae bacterium]
MKRIRETLAWSYSAWLLTAVLVLAVTGAVAQPARDTPPCAGAGGLLCGDIGAPVEEPEVAAERDTAPGAGSGAPRPDTPAGAIAGADDGPTGDVVPRRRPAGADSPAVEVDGLRPRRRADPALQGRSQRPRPRADVLDIPEPDRQAAPARPRAPSLGREGE